MIVINAEEGIIEAHGYGRLTLSDLQALEAASTNNINNTKATSLLLDVRNAEGASLDAILEEWRFAHRHSNDFNKIAIVSEHHLVDLAGCISKVFFAADVEVFESDKEAKTWIYR